MEEGEASEELLRLYELRREFNKELEAALRLGDTTKALGLKDEIERRINAVQELLLPPGSFNKEQREALEAKGYVIYRLTGESIKSLRAKRHRFSSDLHNEYPYLESLPSRLTEVAFNPDPDKFFLPDSNIKTPLEQEWMVEQYSQDLQTEIKGVKAVIGEVPDYAELAFGYKGVYGPLFGKEYNYRYTRTITKVKTELGLYLTRVGCFSTIVGFSFDFWSHSHGHTSIWVAPLVVTSGN